MKKIFVLCAAAIVALSAFSCQKDDTVGVQAPEFNKEGLQKYTFTVSGVETKMTYVTDKTNHKITPKWAKGDRIYVYGSDDAYFEVTDVADNGSATVEGYAEPESGELTLIYHPSLSGKPGNFNLKAQEGHLDKNFPAIYYGSVDLGATKPSASFTLKSFILEISKVPGISSGSVINSIIVEGSTIASGSFSKDYINMDILSGNSVTVTLTSWANPSNVVGDDGTLSESVFISLAPGFISKITVWTNDNSEYYWKPNGAIGLTGGAYKYVSAKTFSLVTPVTPDYPGTDKLPVKVGEIWWAPVNCGGDNALYTWYAAQNCCPTGWRTPTSDELQALVNTGSSWSSSPAGRSFNNGTLFFPAAGYEPNSGGVVSAGTNGYYWSSTEYDSEHGFFMRFDNYNAHVDNNDGNAYKNRSCSVRCVKNAN